MCCTTHPERDRYEAAQGMTVTLAESEDFRCQCGFGGGGFRCNRRATEEDRLCDWCRATDHMKWCFEASTKMLMSYDAPLFGPRQRLIPWP